MPTFAFSDRTLCLEIMDLPPLVGTEKQIAWAEDIRQICITEAARIFEGGRQKMIAAGREIDYPAAVASFSGPLAVAFEQSSAKFWIDHRNTDIRIIAKALREQSK